MQARILKHWKNNYWITRGGRVWQVKKYCVMGSFIHPHKDSTGEYLDKLTYDEAMEILKAWQQDNIHKQVHVISDEALGVDVGRGENE